MPCSEIRTLAILSHVKYLGEDEENVPLSKSSKHPETVKYMMTPLDTTTARLPGALHAVVFANAA